MFYLGNSWKKRIFAFVIELDRHIEILLLSNDCVIVPDFGGFVAHRVHACYEAIDRMFLPPYRTLGFNPQLRLNDSLLVLSYMDAYDISYPEAITRIEHEVEELQQCIADEGLYELNDLGTLSLNENGSYDFVPCEAGVLTPSFYGLSGFEMPLRSDYSAENISEKTFVASVPLPETPKVMHAVEELSDNDELESEDDNDGRISIKLSVLRNMAAAILILVAFLLVVEPFGNDSRQYLAKSYFDFNLLKELMPTEVHTDTPHMNIVSKPAATSSKVSFHATPAKEEHHGFYTIVLASHVTKTNARSFVKQLHKQGFNAANICIQRKRVKVIYGTFATESEARTELNKKQGYSDFKEGWITFIRP